ncbi:hypothetical protein [Flavobacterium piscisymbiosum]|uniref:Uncharacterized protein n=1 Tax=Flavobacterium piscisymbiosum TaxID=2893753 RepID=A0ABS8MDR8_9FLAO|nr:hypothetical protein [Flavobacterium sp. F-30]MCC9063498.1 hypothetical protein [Flavobacterium sp. F-30]
MTLLLQLYQLKTIIQYLRNLFQKTKMAFTLFLNKTSVFQSELPYEQLIQVLKENTFEGILSSTAHQTNKKFIGEIDNYRFKIISAQPKTAMFCVFEGKIEESINPKISITKRFHTSFKWLYVFWVISLLTVIFISTPTLEKAISQAIPFLIIALAIRYFIIKLLFRTAEKNGIETLENLLKLKEID